MGFIHLTIRMTFPSFFFLQAKKTPRESIISHNYRVEYYSTAFHLCSCETCTCICIYHMARSGNTSLRCDKITHSIVQQNSNLEFLSPWQESERASGSISFFLAGRNFSG